VDLNEAGGFTIAWSFVAMLSAMLSAMFENVTYCTWFALFGNSQGVVEGQYFYQATWRKNCKLMSLIVD